jgi:hypothetical protein
MPDRRIAADAENHLHCDKVTIWYVSGDRDAGAIEDPDRFIIDRHARASICRSASAFTAASATG